MQFIRRGINEVLEEVAGEGDESFNGASAKLLTSSMEQILELIDDYEKARPKIVSPVNAPGPDPMGTAHNRDNPLVERGNPGDRPDPRAGIHRRILSPWNDSDFDPGDHGFYDSGHLSERDPADGERRDVRS